MLPEAVRCQCGTTAFVLAGGYIEVRARHHGEAHIVRVPIAELVKRVSQYTERGTVRGE